jgi:serine/threonine protein kinase
LASRAVIYGKYELLQRINVGGMAEVFKARRVESDGSDSFVAIKRILPSIAEDHDFINMFIDEAKLTVQLTHPNIAHTYELGRSNDTYYIAMEYVAGKDLRTIFERLRRSNAAVPPDLAAYVISRIAAALDYAHRKNDEHGQPLGIVHRDVSPQNVIISFDGDVKMIDFGIAKAANKIQNTQVGVLKGKFGYMSPEQVSGKEVDRRSDLFSLGVVLFEILAGERLFVGTNDNAVLDKVRNAVMPRLSDLRKGVPAALEGIVAHALARNPAERYQHASELEMDLRNYLGAQARPFNQNDLAQVMRTTFAADYDHEIRPDGAPPASEEPIDWPRAVPSVSVPKIRSTLLRHDQRPHLEGGVAALALDAPLPDAPRTPKLSTSAMSDDTDPSLHEPPQPVDPSAATSVKAMASAEARGNLEITPEALMFEAEFGLESAPISRMAGLSAPKRAPPPPTPLPSVITELDADATSVTRRPAASAPEVTRVAVLPPETLRAGRQKEPPPVYKPPPERLRRTASTASLILTLLMLAALGVVGLKWWWPNARPKAGYSKLDLFAAPGFGAIQVVTEPADAQVLIDGATVKPGGPQPFTSEHIDTDVSHEIIVRKAGYHEVSEKVTVARGESLVVTLKLTPDQTVLTVDTTPGEAEIWVDGRLEGHSGEAIGTIAAGGHLMRVVRNCYAPIERKITLSESDLALNFQLSPIPGACALVPERRETDNGSLRLYSHPVARVIVDEKDTGRTTPLVDYPITPGHHMIRLVSEDGAREFNALIEPQRPYTQTVVFEKQLKRGPPALPAPDKNKGADPDGSAPDR